MRQKPHQHAFFALPKLPLGKPAPEHGNSRPHDRAHAQRQQIRLHNWATSIGSSSCLENRFRSLGPTRVQIPPPPLKSLVCRLFSYSRSNWLSPSERAMRCDCKRTANGTDLGRPFFGRLALLLLSPLNSPDQSPEPASRPLPAGFSGCDLKHRSGSLFCWGYSRSRRRQRARDVSLPVMRCATGPRESGFLPQFKASAFRTSLSAQVAPGIAGQLAFYSTGCVYVLAPRGWNCFGAWVRRAPCSRCHHRIRRCLRATSLTHGVRWP